MRVAHIYDVKSEVANGIYKAVLGLATHLPDAGVAVEAWNLTPRVSTVVERRVAGTVIYDLPAYTRLSGAVRGLPAQTRAFIREREREVDLVHFHSVFIPHNIWAAKDVKKPYIVTPHGGYGQLVLEGKNRFGKWAWLTWQERAYLQRARLLHAVSEAERDEIVKRWPELNVQCVPNGVDLPPEPLNPLPTTRDFVFIGRLAVDHKGLDRMLRGFAHFIRSRSPGSRSSRLVLAGPDHRGGRTVLEQLAVSEGIQEQVHFAGPMFGAEKAALLANAMAFVHTSRWEGMPFAILEAMSMSAPVLLTRETNFGPIVEQYKAGHIISDGDDPKLVAAAFAKLEDATDQSLAAMRMAARRLVEENYTWKIIARKQAALYAEALASPATNGRTPVGVGSLA